MKTAASVVIALSSSTSIVGRLHSDSQSRLLLQASRLLRWQRKEQHCRVPRTDSLGECGDRLMNVKSCFQALSDQNQNSWTNASQLSAHCDRFTSTRKLTASSTARRPVRRACAERRVHQAALTRRGHPSDPRLAPTTRSLGLAPGAHCTLIPSQTHTLCDTSYAVLLRLCGRECGMFQIATILVVTLQ